MKSKTSHLSKLTIWLAISALITVVFSGSLVAQSPNPQSGSTGLTGTVPTAPPAIGATISFPVNGAVFEDVPIDVTGVCPAGLLVKLFKNEVFAGSVVCSDSGNWTITADLFSGRNTLVARVFDALDQAGPDSNIVNVTYNDAGIPTAVDRVTITTNFAKRGANPGIALKWPFIITGGLAPYAVQVEWGDGETDLISRELAGEFTVSHIYEKPGTYRIVVKVTDANGSTAFVQVVGVANGPIQQVDEPGPGIIVDDEGNPVAQVEPEPTRFKFVLWPLYLMLIFVVSTFWLGRRYEKRKLKKLVQAGELINF